MNAGGTQTWTRGLSRRRRALYISSPIGLGHAQRDVAVAAELRALQPDLEIDWLAQDPVTRVLQTNGERIHPLSAELASESVDIASESTEHELNAFQAIRRMDEILINNFMVFHDAIEEGEYDLVIGDEGWDVDYYLHENPELKRTAFAWMTDFVGWLPMPDGGDREAYSTADYNAEMIEQIARFRGSATGRSSWATRTTSCRTISGRTCRPFAHGPRSTSPSPGMTGFDPSPPLERRDESAGSWTTGPTSGSSS